MGYILEWRPSPNFTPGNQTQHFYGRPRVIEIGAGHWWDEPSKGPSFEGVVNTLLNPARQVGAHAVVTGGKVAEMVRDEDTAWCTGPANPYTYAIEVDPRIMLGGLTAEKIMATLAEYIADKGYHNLPWKPHKAFMATGCNPIDWSEVQRRSQEAWNQKHIAPTPPPPPPNTPNADLEWKKLPEPVLYEFNKNTNLWNFNKVSWANFGVGVRLYTAGEKVTIYGRVVNKTLGATYLVTEYSYTRKITNGFNQTDMHPYVAPIPPVPPAPIEPEWVRNLKDTPDVKLMVLEPQTAIYNLNDLTIIKQLGQGTWVDVAMRTVVNGNEYLISNYSVTNAMPNGILAHHLGLPLDDGGSEKPEWLKNWIDIEDVTMYTRADTALVNLTTGETVEILPRATPVEVASTTEWHGQKYAMTESSTRRLDGKGIRLDDLDINPVIDNNSPIIPSPTQPSLEQRVSALEAIVKAIMDILTGWKR